MLNQEERVAKFFDAISKSAQDRHDELNHKNTEMLNVGLKKAGDKARAQAQAMVEREILLNEQELNRTIAHSTVEKRSELTAKRAEITEKVFESACDKLLTFTKSEAYEGFLKKSVANLAKIFPDGEVVIYVKKDDEKFTSAIIEAFGRECTVEVDETIVIGGCRCKAQKGALVADDTLETRLESQREWFLSNSGMSVVL
ncbi:MAG: V-type ATP synthase subunit E [Clostridia bacterium]|nr:V-type ATP synthase subunit E [Clostridia bacterium]